MARTRKKAAPTEDKSVRFKRVVTPRVKKALKAIALIGNQAGPAYKYTDEEVASIMTALRTAVDTVEKRYVSEGIESIDFTLE